MFRDTADWERLRSTWHPDGTMVATWFAGPAEDFVDASRRAFEAGGRAFHTLGGTSVEVAGERALAQTRMSINVRAMLGDAEVDVVCHGRFVDFFELRDGAWKIVHRRVVYEKDRLDPVIPSSVVKLESDQLGKWPEGYRHLAYLQATNGAAVPVDLPGLRGEAAEALRAEGRRWLGGGPRGLS